MATNTGYIDFNEGAAPATPAASKTRIYAKADGLLYSKDDAGTETLVSGGAGGGSVATDAIWDAAGDLAVGTGANTAARLAIGTTRKALTSNGTTATWAYRSFIGAKAIPNAGTTMTTGTTEYPIAFAGTDSYDTDAFHNPASNNTRMTIPSGLDGYYVVRGLVYIPITAGTSNWVDLKIRLNGAAGTILGQVRHQVAGDGNPITEVFTPPVALVATDYVEMYAMTNVASRTSDASVAWLSIEFVGV